MATRADKLLNLALEIARAEAHLADLKAQFKLLVPDDGSAPAEPVPAAATRPASLIREVPALAAAPTSAPRAAQPRYLGTSVDRLIAVLEASPMAMFGHDEMYRLVNEDGGEHISKSTVRSTLIRLATEKRIAHPRRAMFQAVSAATSSSDETAPAAGDESEVA